MFGFAAVLLVIGAFILVTTWKPSRKYHKMVSKVQNYSNRIKNKLNVMGYNTSDSKPVNGGDNTFSTFDAWDKGGNQQKFIIQVDGYGDITYFPIKGEREAFSLSDEGVEQLFARIKTA
jgi:hypothetical protein